MAPLINFPIDLSRTVDTLSTISRQLERIGDVLERLVPPIQDDDRAASLSDLRRTAPASLSDLRRTDFDSVHRIKEELAVFAQNHQVQLDSDAFIQSIIEYEREIADTYGPESLKELPWNKAAGGIIFAEAKKADEARKGIKA